jgi:microcin C transport system permease protein
MTLARAPWLSPLNRRRWQNFRSNRRGWWSLWIFLALLLLSLPAEFLANDRPLLVQYNGRLLLPVLVDYPEATFGGFLAETDYRDPYIQQEIAAKGWMIWPPIRYSYQTINRNPPTAAPSAPTGENLLGTDEQARDVLARVIYGFRLSVLFGLILTSFSAVIGVFAGAVQGYFGGWVDLVFQRIIEIWAGLPVLYILIIIASFIEPNVVSLLLVLLVFSWLPLTGVVRAEFLRARNLDYVRAARALGMGDFEIMRRHLLPNAMVATLTLLPFVLSASITALTALDFLGYGLPPGEPSLGELLAQGKANLQAPWLGITGFLVVAVTLSLLIFIGEAARDAFDPRKTAL